MVCSRWSRLLLRSSQYSCTEAAITESHARDSLRVMVRVANATPPTCLFTLDRRYESGPPFDGPPLVVEGVYSGSVSRSISSAAVAIIAANLRA